MDSGEEGDGHGGGLVVTEGCRRRGDQVFADRGEGCHAAAADRDHPVADRVAGDALAHGGDPARAFGAERDDALRARVAVQCLEDVAEVESGGGDFDLDLAGAGRGALPPGGGQARQAAGPGRQQPVVAVAAGVEGPDRPRFGVGGGRRPALERRGEPLGAAQGDLVVVAGAQQFGQ